LFSDRGFFPNDVRAGDDVAIPAPIGESSFVLDDGDLGDAGINGGMCGCIVILWEEDETPDLKVGFAHTAYSIAISEALNDHVIENGPVGPTDEQSDEIISKVKSEVEDTIKQGLSLFDLLFRNFDDFLGDGRKSYKFKRGEGESGIDLLGISEQAPPEDTFSFRIVEGQQDYEVFGRVRVEPFTPPAPDPCPEELQEYQAAVDALKNIDEGLARLANEIGRTTGAERAALIALQRFIRDTLRPQALEAVASALAAYEECRARRDRLVLTPVSELASELQTTSETGDGAATDVRRHRRGFLGKPESMCRDVPKEPKECKKPRD
jgi:hypothetical protein